MSPLFVGLLLFFCSFSLSDCCVLNNFCVCSSSCCSSDSRFCNQPAPSFCSSLVVNIFTHSFFLVCIFQLFFEELVSKLGIFLNTGSSATKKVGFFLTLLRSPFCVCVCGAIILWFLAYPKNTVKARRFFEAQFFRTASGNLQAKSSLVHTTYDVFGLIWGRRTINMYLSFKNFNILYFYIQLQLRASFIGRLLQSNTPSISLAICADPFSVNGSYILVSDGKCLIECHKGSSRTLDFLQAFTPRRPLPLMANTASLCLLCFLMSIVSVRL